MNKNFNEMSMEEKEELWKAILKIHKFFDVKTPDFIIFLLEYGTYDLYDNETIGSETYYRCISAVKSLYELAKFCGYEF